MHKSSLDFLLPSDAADPFTASMLSHQLTVSAARFRDELVPFFTSCTAPVTDAEQIFAAARTLSVVQEVVLEMTEISIQFQQEVNIKP